MGFIVLLWEGKSSVAKVSVIIAGRTERYFKRTVESVREAATGDIEVVAVVDGDEAEPKVESDDSRVKVIRLDKSIGQRAAYNLGVRESTGKYVMKIDAHCKLSPGFDEVLQESCSPKTIVLPEMRRLNVHKWQDKPRGKTHYMYFGLDMYCHFWRDYRKRPEAKAEYPEVMTGQGSCWFTTREWNDHIELLDERVGSWGNVGIEVSLRTWLCGGSQVVNKKAWQAHWFRRDEGGFTYPMDGRKVAKAHKYTRENYYFNDHAFEHQERPFSWLIKKFSPPGWEAYLVDEYKSPRVILYYTDSQLDDNLAQLVRKQILKACGPIPIFSVSQKSLKFGTNIVVGEKPRSSQSMFEQMLAGLKEIPEDAIVYLCEHDIFYHPSHFAILPTDKKHAFFNRNRYHYRLGMDCFLKARGMRAYSQGVAYRDVWIEHIKTRIDECKKEGGKKPMHIPFLNFASERPNVDIRHDQNLTPDGDYKRDWLNGLKLGRVPTETNLPGWGGVQHFGSRTGYKPPPELRYPNVPQFLRHKFKNSLPQPSPVRCIKFTRNKMAEMFGELEFKCGAEIGVREGLFSEQLCKSINGLELFCIDIWEPYPGHKSKDLAAKHYAEAQERLKPYNAHLIKMDNAIAAKDIPDKSLDFIYIDAAHRFDNVMMDLLVWVPKVKSGGIISGHDYYRGRNNGVVPAVDAYKYAHQIHEWYLTDEKEATFFWVKS